MTTWTLAADGKSVTLSIFEGELSISRKENGVLKGLWVREIPSAEEGVAPRRIEVSISCKAADTVAQAQNFAPERLLKSLTVTSPHLLLGESVDPAQPDPF